MKSENSMTLARVLAEVRNLASSQEEIKQAIAKVHRAVEESKDLGFHRDMSDDPGGGTPSRGRFRHSAEQLEDSTDVKDVKINFGRTRTMANSIVAGHRHSSFSADSSDESRGIKSWEPGRGKRSTLKGWADHTPDQIVCEDLPHGWPGSLRFRMEASDEDATIKLNGNHLALNSISEQQPVTAAHAASLQRAFTMSALSSSLRQSLHSHTGSSPQNSGLASLRALIGNVVVDPNSRRMAAFDLFAIVVLLYELILTPYTVVWKIEMRGMRYGASAAACIFWIFDLCLSFVLGYLDDTGCLVLEQPRVALHYLQTWFTVDGTLIVLHAMVLLLLRLDEAPQRTLRVVNMSRMFILLRSTRLLRIVEKVTTTLNTKRLMFFSLCKVLGFTLLLSHFLSCVWYFIGKEVGSDTSIGWVSQLSDYGPLWEYTTSVHWVLSQLTLGANDIIPTSSAERIFTIVLMVFGLLYGSTIISFFSAQVMQMVVLRQEESALKLTLRRYLRQQLISHKLSSVIIQQVRQRCSEEAELQEEDVKALPLLATSLRNSLRKEVRMPILLSHALWQTWSKISSDGLGMLCCTATNMVMLPHADDLFLPLQTAIGAYCVAKGELNYEPMPGMLFPEAAQIEMKTWLCEAALWLEWIHVGTASAEGDCNLLWIDAAKLASVVRSFRLVMSVTVQYARDYVARVAAATPPYAPHFPDDRLVPLCNPPELLSQEVGLGLLRLASERNEVPFSLEQYVQLEDELRKGKCTLQQTDEGLQRLVSLVVVSLKHDNMLFMQVGAIEGGLPRVSCQLPGTKQGKGELATAALKRIFKQTLWPLTGLTQLDKTQNSSERMESSTYGIPTVYIRTEFHMELKVGIAALNETLKTMEHSGLVVDIAGVETLLTIYMVHGEEKSYLFTWVHEDDMLELKRDVNVERMREWSLTWMAA